MKNSRRIKRMSRNRVKLTKLNLTSLMDVFTILVFFLLVNSGSPDVLETPKEDALRRGGLVAKSKALGEVVEELLTRQRWIRQMHDRRPID